MYINVKRQFLYRMIYAMKFYWVRCWVMGKATVRCHFEIDLSFYLSFLLYYYDFVIIIFFFLDFLLPDYSFPLPLINCKFIVDWFYDGQVVSLNVYNDNWSTFVF